MAEQTYDELITELEGCKQQMFDRYDIDRSGTLNSAKELRQLCTNLCIKLRLVVKVDTIEEWCQSAGDMDTQEWSLDQFVEWFKEVFIAKLAPDAPGAAAGGGGGGGEGGGEVGPVGTLHNHVLDNDEQYCWVMIFPNESHESCTADDEGKAAMKQCREDSIKKMLCAGLALKKYQSVDGDEYVVEIGAPQPFLEFIATQIKIPVKHKKTTIEKDAEGNETEVTKEGYKPFDMLQKDQFIGMNADWCQDSFVFRSKPRQQIVQHIIRERWCPEMNLFGAGLDTQNMLLEGQIKHFFPTHGPLLAEFDETWSKFSLACCCVCNGTGMWNQPIDQIRDYFGEKLAMYFSFLGFYCFNLMSPAFWGLACGIVQIVLKDSLPTVAMWAVVGYCIQIVVWATVFLENWKRKEAENAHRWGMRGLLSKEQPLPRFQGVYDEHLETLVYDQSQERSRACWINCYAMIVLICLISVSATMVFYIWLQSFMQRSYQMGAAVSTLNAISIIVFNDMYKMLAACLTESENHRTETEYQNSLVVKCFLFQFINSYFSLYITCFIKPFAVAGHVAGKYTNGTIYSPAVTENSLHNIFGACSCKTYTPADCYTTLGGATGKCDDTDCTNLPISTCACTEYNCQGDVGTTLMIFFVTQIVWGNISEIIVPQIVFYFKNRAAGGYTASDEGKTRAEKEATMPNYEEFVYAGIFDDYNELALQFGFVTLFATNFPFVGLLAWINNLVEIRSDAFKFVHVYRRPTPRPCENIGSWYMVMEIMTFAAVTTNCANVFFVSELKTQYNLSFSMQVFGMFAAEHICYALKVLIAMSISDVSPETQREIDYEEAMKEKAVFEDMLRRVSEDFANDLPLYRDANVPVVCDFVFPKYEPPPPPEGDMVGIEMGDMKEGEEAPPAEGEPTPGETSAEGAPPAEGEPPVESENQENPLITEEPKEEEKKPE
jgi:hypothetical protein